MPTLSLHSPVGDLTLAQEDDALVALEWGWGRDQEETPLLVEARRQLTAYFAGARTGFDLPLHPWGSAFRQRLWTALSAIPYSHTRSYGELAALLGSSPRAIGGACAANPLPILIPCHRVLAASGRPGGYSGGEGLETKQRLLALERHVMRAQ